jgi:hypothetical protein
LSSFRLTTTVFIAVVSSRRRYGEDRDPFVEVRLGQITSGLPDDSREEDERQVARRLRDVRSRVKAARAVVSTTPGLAETLQGDWRKAALFYARFGIMQAEFRQGVPARICIDRKSSESFDSESWSAKWAR